MFRFRSSFAKLLLDVLAWLYEAEKTHKKHEGTSNDKVNVGMVEELFYSSCREAHGERRSEEERDQQCINKVVYKPKCKGREREAPLFSMHQVYIRHFSRDSVQTKLQHILPHCQHLSIKRQRHLSGQAHTCLQRRGAPQSAGHGRHRAGKAPSNTVSRSRRK